MSVLRSHFALRRRQFHNSWPGLRAFWPGLPIGFAVGSPFFIYLRTIWIEPLAAWSALFVTFTIFLLVQAQRELPLMRTHPGLTTLLALSFSAAGAAVSVFVGSLVGRGVRLLFDSIGALI